MFIVEGNIGTGKTTMLEAIKKHMPYLSVQFESVAQWQKSENSESILQRFYNDAPRWAYTMEIASLKTRIPEHISLQENKNITQVLERSIYSGLHCFAYNGYLSKFLQPVEWEVFKQWFDFAVRKCETPRGFIYLQADPKVSYERTKKRNRAEESTLPLDYINQIHQRHEEFLVHKKNVHHSIKETPVLVLDCNEDLATDQAALFNRLEQIERFIAETKTEFTPQYKYDAYQL
jgi:deoxyadenosine/deoxycytidine kinase